MPLHVVILAAGQGKRMRSALPKVLHRIAGRPLLAYVIEAARSLKPERVFVVHGHGGTDVKAAFAGTALEWVEQTKRLGTGHALMQALPRIPRAATVLVLNGDVPLIRAATLRKLVRVAAKELSITNSDWSDTAGHGRGGRRIGETHQHKSTDASSSRRMQVRRSARSANGTRGFLRRTARALPAGWRRSRTEMRRRSTTSLT
jgi:bifunctional UDP-N-acetylglucosamine pyrophosphorylase/glucosamine-1-phosphate N-acetyltransferase